MMRAFLVGLFLLLATDVHAVTVQLLLGAAKNGQITVAVEYDSGSLAISRFVFTNTTGATSFPRIKVFNRSTLTSIRDASIPAGTSQFLFSGASMVTASDGGVMLPLELGILVPF